MTVRSFHVLLLLAALLTSAVPVGAAPVPCIDYTEYMQEFNHVRDYWPWGIKIVANLAYCVDSMGLRIFDVTDPMNLVQVGFVAADVRGHTPAIAGGYAFMCAGYWGVVIADVRVTSAPRVVSTIDVPGNADDIAVSGRFAYVTGRDRTLTILDISDPLQPRIVSSLNEISGCSVALSGNYAIVASEFSGAVDIIDVSNPANPRIVGKWRFTLSGNWPKAVAVSGRTIYMAGHLHGLRVIDFTDPTRPTVIGTVDFDNANKDIVLNGSQAYVCGSDGMYVIDVANPRAPTVIGRARSNIETRHLDVSNGIAYLGSSNGILQIDVSNPHSPPAAGSIALPGYPRDSVLRGDLAFVANRQGLLTVDISDRGRPQLVGSVATTDGSFAVDLAGSLALVAAYSAGVQVIDVSDPRQPVLRESLPVRSTAMDVQVRGREAFVADRYFGLRIFDLGGGDGIRECGDLALPGQAWIISVAGNTALVCSSYPHAVHIVDVSNPRKPVRVGGIAGIYPNDAVQVGHLAFLAFGERLRIVDIADPAAPRIVSETTTVGYAYSVLISGGHAYVGGNRGVEVLDISDPAHPFRLGVMPGRDVEGLMLAGDVVCAVDGMDAFTLLPLQCGAPSGPPREVAIDIRPGDEENVVNCALPGLLTVAVLAGGGVDIGAISHGTVRFGSGHAAEVHANRLGATRHEEDVDHDGDLDLVFHFELVASGITCGDTKAMLSGFMVDGTPFIGSEVIRTQWGGDKGPAGVDLPLSVSPNPFNPRAKVSFGLAAPGHVRLAVFDLAGRRVRTLVDEVMAQGRHECVWDGRDASGRDVGSGTYVARLDAGGRIEAIRMGLLR